jgi:hypothetical protein
MSEAHDLARLRAVFNIPFHNAIPARAISQGDAPAFTGNRTAGSRVHDRI